MRGGWLFLSSRIPRKQRSSYNGLLGADILKMIAMLMSALVETQAPLSDIDWDKEKTSEMSLTHVNLQGTLEKLQRFIPKLAQ